LSLLGSDDGAGLLLVVVVMAVVGRIVWAWRSIKAIDVFVVQIFVPGDRGSLAPCTASQSRKASDSALHLVLLSRDWDEIL